MRGLKAEVIFVRVVTAVIWFCVSPLLAPFYLYVNRWVPWTSHRLVLIAGCGLMMIVPLAAPQSSPAQITEREIQQLYSVQKDFGALIGSNQLAISSLNGRVLHNENALNEMKSDIAAMKVSMQESKTLLAGIATNTKSTSENAGQSQTSIAIATAVLAIIIRFEAVIGIIRRVAGPSKSVGAVLLLLGSWIRHKIGG